MNSGLFTKETAKARTKTNKDGLMHQLTTHSLNDLLRGRKGISAHLVPNKYTTDLLLQG